MKTTLLPIREIAGQLQIPEQYCEYLGTYGAKVRLDLLRDAELPPRGRLILVTATTPTTSGEGKTVVSIGLAEGLARIGRKAIVTSREPSLGPVFGMKGGAAGGGRAQVEPSQKINLHFHGDFHAITSAHNLLAALIDSHLYFGNALDIDPATITWPRALDMNDRALRHVVVGVDSRGDAANRASGFVITAASEVMAILGLSTSRDDLRRRLDAIVIGATRAGQPVTAADLGATGAMLALLYDALRPNLVQTTEGTPAFVHTGPFANIAHGTSSVVSQQMAVRLADYVVNECGFAADLGAEKYFDIVMRVNGILPAAAVLVVTVQSLRAQGEGNLEAGFTNLRHHVHTLRCYGVPVVVAINRFPADKDAELAAIAAECESLGVGSAPIESFARGGAGAESLAEKVVALIDAHPVPDVQPIYALDAPLEEKLRAVATKIYGADGVTLSAEARAKLDRYAAWGFAALPVCIAKTQYSLTDDPKRMGAPSGWTLHISDVSLSAGAGFVVAVAGNMMLMPGLPRTPRALSIDVGEDGEITGV